VITKKLGIEISELKQMFAGGGLQPIIERMVGEFLNREREKEPEARITGKNDKASTSGIFKEFMVISDEIKILQNQLRELQRNVRLAQDDICESRQNIFML
jgi:hypothetical protein